MSLTITLEPAILAELEAEALAREVSCEQLVSEAVEDYLQKPKSPCPEYDAFFRKKYEKGMADYEAGRIRTNEEVEKEARIRREKLKELIAARR